MMCTGNMIVTGSVVFSSNASSIRASEVLFSNTSTLVVSAEAGRTVAGVNVIAVASFQNSSGAFGTVALLAPPCFVLSAATPIYGSSSLSVAFTATPVQNDACSPTTTGAPSSGLSGGAIAGIVVGVVVGGVLIAVGIVLIIKHQTLSYTKTANSNLRQSELSSIQRQ